MWAANDTMALGALDAAKLSNSRVLVGGMGALREALESVIDGGLAGIVAGDYFVGAWAMVLLYDYHWGKDFAKHGGPRLKLDYLSIIERKNARRFADVVFGRIEALDVRRYSKHLNQRSGPYDFDLKYLFKTTTQSL